MDSWERPYDGHAAEALWTHIRNHYDPDSDKIYAHFCSVVQSSGMGKSRTVDELGKEHFSILINLRDARSTGIFFSCTIVSFAVTNNIRTHLSRIPSCRPRSSKPFDHERHGGRIISPGLLFYGCFVSAYRPYIKGV
jgi:hypothetical protein